jgi:hypothetical protein
MELGASIYAAIWNVVNCGACSQRRLMSAKSKYLIQREAALQEGADATLVESATPHRGPQVSANIICLAFKHVARIPIPLVLPLPPPPAPKRNRSTATGSLNETKDQMRGENQMK